MGSEKATNENLVPGQQADLRHQHRLAKQRLQTLITRIAGAAIGCAIVILSVVNISLNLIEFRQTLTADLPPGTFNWWYAIPFIFVTGVIPLLAGFWLLFGSMNGLGEKATSVK